MMDFLFSILLVPIFPELGDPRESHTAAMAELGQRLSAGQGQAANVPEREGSSAPRSMDSLSVYTADLPPITGRLFQWSSTQLGSGANRRAAVNLSAESLRLTGLIESAGQRVAILNDGQVDHVVGMGSYVLDAYRVTSFGPRQVVLSRIDFSAGEERLELNLMPMNIPEDAQ